jgi:hypothetical protein
MWIAIAVGVTIAMGRMTAEKDAVKRGDQTVVRNAVGNFTMSRVVREMDAKGYDVKSDQVHMFGKHTLVFVKREM